MKAAFIFLLSISAWASEYRGFTETYKPADHSSTIHNRLKGESAEQFYKLMVNVQTLELPGQKLTIRKSKDIECIHFYGDGYFECFFRINESGDIEAGY